MINVVMPLAKSVAPKIVRSVKNAIAAALAAHAHHPRTVIAANDLSHLY